MATLYSPQTVTNGLVILFDPLNRKITNGTTTLYNGASKSFFPSVSYNYGSSSWGSILQDGTCFFSGSKLNNNTDGNFLYSAGDLSSTIDNSSFTTVAWVYRMDASSKATICEYRGVGTRLEFSVDATSMYFSQRLRASPFTTHSTSVAAPVPQNTWTHCALSRTGSLWSFYKDGVLVGENTFSQPESMGAGVSISIGIAWSDDDYASSCMIGKIGNWAQYNRNLSASEINQNYNATKGRFGR